MHMVNSRGRTEFQNYSKLENTIDTVNNFIERGVGGDFALCDIYITCSELILAKRGFFFNCQLSLQTMNSGRKLDAR